MKLVLRIFGGLVLVLLVAVATVLLGARFADGPLEIIVGGPFKSGTPHSGPEPDWSFVKDIQTIELQSVEPARSRTTWVLYHDGRAYIPCGYMDSTWGRIWKQWPIEAERDGRVIARIDGKLYDRYLVRIKDKAVRAPVIAELFRKYIGQTAPEDTAATQKALWIFELAPRG